MRPSARLRTLLSPALAAILRAGARAQEPTPVPDLKATLPRDRLDAATDEEASGAEQQ
jgi:hypothetical protein